MIPTLAKAFTRMIALVGAALSAPAIACLCSDWEPSGLEARASEYEQIFAGLIIWTETTDEPVLGAPFTTDYSGIDPGYWAKSKVLVLRVWRGAPSMVTEVWTPVASSCDLRPLPAFYFVALVKREKGRNVDRYNYCDGPLRAYATRGPATLAPGGYALLAVILGVVFIAFTWLRNKVRRKRASTGRA